MTFIGRIAVAATATLLLAACGGGAGGGGRSSSTGSYGAGTGGGGFGFGFGCLEVEVAAGGDAALLLVRLFDPTTGDEVQEYSVFVLPGEDVDLMDVPAGDYLVDGVFDDGDVDPRRFDPRPEVTVDPVVEASIVFAHR